MLRAVQTPAQDLVVLGRAGQQVGARLGQALLHVGDAALELSDRLVDVDLLLFQGDDALLLLFQRLGRL